MNEVLPVALLRKRADTKKDDAQLDPLDDEKPLESLCYRLRAALAHARSSKVQGWKPPVRFGVLRALIAQAQVGPPPAELQFCSPRKKELKRELVWLPGPMIASIVEPAPCLHDAVDLSSPKAKRRRCVDLTPSKHSEDDVIVVQTPAKRVVAVVDLLDDEECLVPMPTHTHKSIKQSM